MLATATREDDLDAGMDLPVTEDSVRALVTRMMQEDTRTAGHRTLLTAASFQREEEEDECGSF